MKLKNSLLILAIAAAPVFAMDAQPSNLSKTVPLKGGETLYVFKAKCWLQSKVNQLPQWATKSPNFPS
jgi:hypothetical protein